MPHGAPGPAGPPRSSFLRRRIRLAGWFAGILTLPVLGHLLRYSDGPAWGWASWWEALLLIAGFFGMFLGAALFVLFHCEAEAASSAAAARPAPEETDALHEPGTPRESKGPPLP